MVIGCRWSLVPHEGQSGYRVPLNGLWVVVWGPRVVSNVTQGTKQALRPGFLVDFILV